MVEERKINDEVKYNALFMKCGTLQPAVTHIINWDTFEYHDTTDSGKRKEAKEFTFYRIETKDISERYDAPCFVKDLEAYDGEINLEHDKNLISNEFAAKLCLEHEVKNGEKVVKELILDDELELEEVEANEEMIKEYKAIKEKEDPGVFVLPIRLKGIFDTHALADTGSSINIIPYHIFEELGREHVKPVSHNVSMLNHSEAEPVGMLKDILCQIGVTTVLARFLILDMPVDRIVPIIVGRSFLHTWSGDFVKEVGDGKWHTKIRVTDLYGNTFEQGYETRSTNRKKLNFHKLSDIMSPHWTIGTHDDEAGSSRPKQTRQSETMEEAMLLRIHHEFLLWGMSNRAAKTRFNTNLARLLPK
ncbi:agenet domain-containing protein [Tanacetum coccineum]|uniref:Agenet domain-containing protein n=1 Tax=Tanacetum coccineum TaxID=301880 RepID=A0ABQ5CKH4_9ASTR